MPYSCLKEAVGFPLQQVPLRQTLGEMVALFLVMPAGVWAAGERAGLPVDEMVSGASPSHLAGDLHSITGTITWCSSFAFAHHFG